MSFLCMLISTGRNRKDSQNRSEKIKVCQDIIDCLFDIDEHVDVICLALSWSKLPKVAPESVTDLSLAEKVAEMEAKFKIYDDTLSEIKAQQLIVQQHPRPLMSEVLSRPAQGQKRTMPLRTMPNALGNQHPNNAQPNIQQPPQEWPPHHPSQYPRIPVNSWKRCRVLSTIVTGWCGSPVSVRPCLPITHPLYAPLSWSYEPGRHRGSLSYATRSAS